MGSPRTKEDAIAWLRASQGRLNDARALLDQAGRDMADATAFARNVGLGHDERVKVRDSAPGGWS